MKLHNLPAATLVASSMLHALFREEHTSVAGSPSFVIQTGSARGNLSHLPNQRRDFVAGIVKAVQSFGKLENNWNSYGAAKISKGVIDSALVVLKTLRDLDMTPDRVSPSAENSVLFEIFEDERTVLVEVFDDEAVAVLIKANEEPPQIVDATVADFSNAFTCRRE